MEEVTAGVVGFQVEPEDVTKLLQSHDKTSNFSGGGVASYGRAEKVVSCGGISSW